MMKSPINLPSTKTLSPGFGRTGPLTTLHEKLKLFENEPFNDFKNKQH